MSDISDIATDTEHLFLDVAMKTKLPILHHIGSCWNCSEPLKAGIYCSIECSEDHEKVQRAKRFNVT